MSTETRTIRPYRGVDNFQVLLNGAFLRLGDRDLKGGSRSSVTIDEYLNHPISFFFAGLDHEADEIAGLIADGLADLGRTPSDVELVVLATSPRLKMVDLIYSKRLDEVDDIPRQIDFPRPRPQSMRGPFGGCDVRAFFCLAREFHPQPLRPWRKGTWLGKQEFLLRTDASGIGFMPVKLTDELRSELALDHEVTKFACIDPDISVFDQEVPADAVLVYIDDLLLDRLSVAARTAVGKQVQRQLFLEAAWAIAARAQQEIREDPSLIRAAIDEFTGSLIFGLVVMLAGGGTDDASQNARDLRYRELLRDPARFLSNLEARLASRRDVMSMFGD